MVDPGWEHIESFRKGFFYVVAQHSIVSQPRKRIISQEPATSPWSAPSFLRPVPELIRPFLKAAPTYGCSGHSRTLIGSILWGEVRPGMDTVRWIGKARALRVRFLSWISSSARGWGVGGLISELCA